jgi:hypothetical protein
MNLKRLGIGIVIAIVIAIAAVALFGNKTIDSDDLESKLTSQAAEQTRVSEDSIDVSCPDDIEAEEGKVFDCDATLEDQQATIEVRLTDDEGTYVATFK